MSALNAPRLRVAHVSLGLETGGQEKLLVEFVRHADHALLDITVISLTGCGRLAGLIEEAGGRVLSLNEPAGIRPSMVFRLRKLFHAEGFDVVHTHDDRPLVYAAPAAWLAGVSVRVHTHHHGQLGPVSWKARMLLCAAARCVNLFSCVSQDSAKYVLGLGIPPTGVRTLCNGIDVERFLFRGPDDTGPAVCVARLSVAKGHAALLRAARQVADAQPTFRLEIAGDGPCREELLTQCAKLRLQNHVNFLGEVGDVPALLARASLFVLPSRSEGISLTLLEAMASGLPVVTTHVGGNPEVVKDGVTGLLVPPDDPDALARAVLDITSDSARGRRFGRAGRERVAAHFDVRHMVRHYESLYAGGMNRSEAPVVVKNQEGDGGYR